jgi:hypothetical protein
MVLEAKGVSMHRLSYIGIKIVDQLALLLALMLFNRRIHFDGIHKNLQYRHDQEHRDSAGGFVDSHGNECIDGMD